MGGAGEEERGDSFMQVPFCALADIFRGARTVLGRAVLEPVRQILLCLIKTEESSAPCTISEEDK